jgi:hypothetical protein
MTDTLRYTPIRLTPEQAATIDKVFHEPIPFDALLQALKFYKSVKVTMTPRKQEIIAAISDDRYITTGV